MTTPHPALRVTDEVRYALHSGLPVVALESTIISHGMPYPDNVRVARETEQIIRDAGVTPATIAVLDGEARVGLSEDELTLLGQEEDVAKVSVRDLPVVAARQQYGATTVAATMRLAALAGIGVFVTGGLGGVHRGAEQSFDESADLRELATSDVAVVCAGVKSILDIGLTLERLESSGVPVLGVGTDEFPSFFSRSSGFAVPWRVESAEEAAGVVRAQRELGLGGGAVVANPIPADDEIPAEEMAGVIDQALAEMAEQGVQGSDATPYLLDRVVALTDGASLQANIALVRHNACVGAALAAELGGR